MPYLKNRCISDIKVHPWMLFELLIDGRNHISFLEKLCCSLFIDDLKDITQRSDYLFVRWLLDILQLIFKPIFSQDHHLTFEYLVVILLEKLLVREVDAYLLDRVLFKVLKAEDVKQVNFAEAVIVVLNGRQHFVAVLLVVRTKSYFDLIDYRLEYGIVKSLAKCITF